MGWCAVASSRPRRFRRCASTWHRPRSRRTHTIATPSTGGTKAELAERLIRAAERVVPGLAAHIDWQETATPVTQQRFTHSTGGTSYGIESAFDQMGPLRIGPETEIPGLYVCGASTPSGHGIGSVLRSGVAAAGAVLGRNLMRAIVGGEVLGDRDRLPPLRGDWDPWVMVVGTRRVNVAGSDTSVLRSLPARCHRMARHLPDEDPNSMPHPRANFRATYHLLAQPDTVRS